MIITVASGKGGAGKTMVTASLASVWDTPFTALDLDVEAPNLHLFLQQEPTRTEILYMETPEVDASRCTRCRACSDLCQFKAIAVLGDTVMTFPEMCHGCGGCFAVCPENAITSGRREIGAIEYGCVGDIPCITGRLRVGEAMSPPLIREVKKRRMEFFGQGVFDAIADAPPGVSCPAVTAVMDSDYILMVAEATPFGLHDFKLALESFRPLGIPLGVVVNKTGLGYDDVQRFCKEQHLDVLAEIPFEQAIARAYSLGAVAARVDMEIKQIFETIRDGIKNSLKETAHA